MKKQFVLLFLLWCACLGTDPIHLVSLWAAATAKAASEENKQLVAEVSSNLVAEGDSFQLTLRFIGISDDDFNDPALPKGFTIAGKSTSSSFQLINGKSFSQKTFTYEILAESFEGKNKITIGPFTVKDGKNAFTSNSIEIQNAASNKSSKNSKQIENTLSPFEITAIFSKNPVYVGEQTLLIINLNSQEGKNQIQYREVSVPEIPGVQVEDYGKPQVETKLDNGIRATSVRLIKKLTPIKPGVFETQGVKAIADVLSPGPSRQDDFFFGTFQEQYQKTTKSRVSQPLKLEVKPLPLENRPANFSGLVGETSWEVRSSLKEKMVTKSGESHNITVKISSTGDLAGIKIMPPTVSDNIKVYADEGNVTTEIRNNQLIYLKEFKFATVLVEAGKAFIKPIQLTFFSPAEGKYKTLEHTFSDFEIQQNSSKGDNNKEHFSTKETEKSQNIIQNELTEKKETVDVFSIRTRAEDFYQNENTSIGNILIFPAIISIFYLLIEVIIHFRSRLPNWQVFMKQHNALHNAQKALNEMKQKKRAKNPSERNSFLDISQVIRRYLHERIRKDFAKSTATEVCRDLDKLLNKPEESRRAQDSQSALIDLKQLILDLEKAAYAGSHSPEEIAELVDIFVARSLIILNKFDKAF